MYSVCDVLMLVSHRWIVISHINPSKNIFFNIIQFCFSVFKEMSKVFYVLTSVVNDFFLLSLQNSGGEDRSGVRAGQ